MQDYYSFLEFSLACVAGAWKLWAKKKRAREETRVSPSRAPVLSFALYFQAPAKQAKFSQSVFSSLVGLAWLGRLKDQWERILLSKTVFCTFSLNKIGKWPCHERDYALRNCKYAHICSRKFADIIFG